MTPEEIRSIRERLGLTQVKAGELLGGGPRAFAKYEAGTIKPAASVINLLHVLDAQPDGIKAIGGSAPRRAGHGTPPFEISGEDVKRLPQANLPELLRQLLYVEAVANGLPQDRIHVAGNVNTPDGGEDGRIEWDGEPDRTQFLPGRRCQFQIKAGEISPVQAGREVLKPMVRSMLEAGGCYIMLSGHRYSKQLVQRREASMHSALQSADVDIKKDQVFFRDADQVAAWANHHQTVALWIKEQTAPGTVGPFRSWSHWACRTEHEQSPWVDDERLIDLSKWLHGRLATERGVARVVGLPGIGKSRLALEAVGNIDSTLGAIAMYTVESESDTHTINDVVRNLVDAGTKAIVVVDECTIKTHRVLAGMVSRSSSRLSLITMGTEFPSGTADDATFLVSEAPYSVSEAIVRRVVPSLPSVDERRVVQLSKGFPKIAYRIANLWGSVPIAHATDDDLVDAFVLGNNSEERELRLRSTRLLSAFGLIRVEPASDCALDEIARLGRNLNAKDLRSSISPRVQQGAAQRQGQYVVIQPRPIAMNLAERQWNEWSPDTWDIVLTGAIRSDLRVSAARQLSMLNDTEIAERVVTHVCRPAGPLDVLNISEPDSQRVLSALAEIDPGSIVPYVERSINEWDLSKISKTVGSDLVRALAKVAFDSTTFSDGARLLLRIAIAEEQILGNMTNQLRRASRRRSSEATSAFQSLFPAILGNTSADGTARLFLLDEALEDAVPVQHNIIVKALIEGLTTTHFSRQLGPEVHGSRPALNEWYPATRKDLDDYIEGCITRLGGLATNDDEAGASARVGLSQNLHSLIAHGYIDTVETVILQVSGTRDPWTAVLNSLGLILTSDADWLDDETATRIKKLLAQLHPQTLESRIRAHVIHGMWDHDIDGVQFVESLEHHQHRVDSIRRLADEAFARPEILAPLLSELSNGKQNMAFEFGKAVADCDQRLLWRDPIVQAVVQSADGERNYDLVTGYLAGTSQRRPDKLTEFKEKAKQSPDLAPCLPLLCRRVGISSDDIGLIMQALQNGLLPPLRLKEWRVQTSMDDVSEKAIVPLFNMLVEHSPDSFEVAVELVDCYINDDTQRLDGLRPLILKIAQMTARWKLTYDTMTGFRFERLMNRVLDEGRQSSSACSMALELTKSLLNSNNHDDMHLMDPILPKLLSDFPEISWPLIGHTIVSNHDTTWRLEHILGRHPFGVKKKPYILFLPSDAMFAWCHAYPEHAPAFVAGVLPILATPREDARPYLHPTMERLLIDFGRRSDVEERIKRNIETLGWSRSEEAQYAQFEMPLKELILHRVSHVRVWAKKMLNYLSSRKQEAMSRDTERRGRSELWQ